MVELALNFKSAEKSSAPVSIHFVSVLEWFGTARPLHDIGVKAGKKPYWKASVCRAT